MAVRNVGSKANDVRDISHSCNLFHIIGPHYLARGGLLRFNVGPRRHHLYNSLHERRRRKREVGRCRLSGINDNSKLKHLLIPDDRGFDIILTRNNIQNKVRPIDIGRRSHSRADNDDVAANEGLFCIAINNSP